MTTATNLVLIAEGESNGRDDSDGFIIYFDLYTGKFITDHWTTRFGCNTKDRKHRTYKELTDDELQKVRTACHERALKLLKDMCEKENYRGHISFTVADRFSGRTIKGIPVIVEKGRKFRGEGELVKIEYKYFNYGWNRAQTAESYIAHIKTPDGIKFANIKFVEIPLDKIDLAQIAKMFSYDIIEDDGFNGNIVRYSDSLSVGQLVLKKYVA